MVGSEPSPDELLEAATHGDRAALERLVEENLPGLMAYVQLHAGPKLALRESSSDLVQSACREVLQKLSSFREYRDAGDFRRWLFVTVERKILDRARYHGVRDVRSLDQQPGNVLSDADVGLLSCAYSAIWSPSQQAIAREDLERVEAAFARLPEDYREIIVAVRILGRTHAELAAETGKTEEAMRALLHRAVARLAREAGFGAE